MRRRHFLFHFILAPFFLAFFLAVPFAVYAVQPDEMLENQALERRARAIGEELRCLVCQNQSIDDSDAPLAHDLRLLLRRRLATGDSDEAAQQYIVARYGDYVLLKPPLKISTLALWFGPLFLLLASLACATGFYRRREMDGKEQSNERPETRRVAQDDRHAARRIMYVSAPLILITAGLLYAYLGSPSLPDRPFAERQSDPDFRLNTAAETIDAELEAHPDAEGYRRLAGMFYALHRYDRAADTAREAIEHGINDAQIWSQLGESLVMENDGAVGMDALKAFKTALARDPHEPRARFYFGLAESEIGNLKKAVAIWRDLEKSAPMNAPWLRMVKDNIALYAKQGGFDPTSIPPAPPNLK